MKTHRWHSCNVLQVRNDSRLVWQFAPGNGEVTLNSEGRFLLTHPLPPTLVSKDWRTLWQKKLNIAWLPAEQVFLRAVQLPKGDVVELRPMVELQLEKLSPLPVNQIVWSFEALPQAAGELQSVIVIIVERSVVEEFLGRLEGDGYLADRLELPLLNHLLATAANQNEGAWVLLNPSETRTLCLVAWWIDGALRNLNLLSLPAGAAGAEALGSELTRITWAGELEGWLTGQSQWYLVADEANAAHYEPALRQWAGQAIELHPLPGDQALAAWTAQRAARPDSTSNLLPPEFAARYRQRFIDRLWMRGLAAVILLYLGVVLVYFGWLEVVKIQRGKVEDRITALGGSYTNALQLRARLKTLQEQVALRYGALDSWRIVSELLPADLTLTLFSFSKGDRLSLRGTAASEHRDKIVEYNTAIGKATLNGAPLFSKVKPATFTVAPNSPQVVWNFECELARATVQ